MFNDREAGQACILNYGPAAWAFDSLASQLATRLGVEVASRPRAFNYVLGADPHDLPSKTAQFVDVETIQGASDKRLLVSAFAAAGVPTPITRVVEDLSEARAIVRAHRELEWCLKYPTGTGAAGHRLFTFDTEVPREWPTPYVVQEFVRLARPEVYRTYAAGGELFGWMLRRYDGGDGSPWVAHAVEHVGTAYRNFRPLLPRSPPVLLLPRTSSKLLAASISCSDPTDPGSSWRWAPTVSSRMSIAILAIPHLRTSSLSASVLRSQGDSGISARGLTKSC